MIKVDDVKTCPYCGKRFAKTRNFQRYCCAQHREKAYEEKVNQAKSKPIPGVDYTLCWDCANACGNCRWSSKLKPVKGWRAKKSTKIEGSYMVRQCPKYKKG
jgi:hypothetical protein